MRTRFEMVVLAAAVAGCGARTGLDVTPAPGIGPADASEPPDAGPVTCTRLEVVATAALDDPVLAGVSPVVVALPHGETGVAYVSVDGSPTRVVWERLDAELRRLTGPVVVTAEANSWAAPCLDDGDVRIAWALDPQQRTSALSRIDLDGALVDAPREVPIGPPSVLLRDARGLFWMSFAMEAENALRLAHLGPDGGFLHEVVTIPMGRYGAGHGALARPDGRSEVLGYPREGPPGVRDGWVNAIDESGALGPERHLGDEGDHEVRPVLQDGALVLVRSNDTALVLERIDLASLATLGSTSFEPLPLDLAVAVVAGRLVIAHLEGNLFVMDDHGTDLATRTRTTEPLPELGRGSGASAAAFPDGVVFAFGLVDGARAHPWLVRAACR